MRSLQMTITAPKVFAAVSLALIVAVAIASSATESSFYRRAIIDREAAIIRDMVEAMVMQEQAEGDLNVDDFAASTHAVRRLDHVFRPLTNVFGEARVKVFNLDGRIVWSDKPGLIGKQFTRNPDDLARALRGELRAVFDPPESLVNPDEGLPRKELIEFYVPFSLAQPHSPLAVTGVVSLYRSPRELNATIAEGRLLLWSVTGAGGALLFVALYILFRRVYFGKRQLESQFAKLTTEHARIMQIEKLSAMGRLVSEIAHQLNNPLVGVLNLTQLAEREIDDKPRVKELLGEVRRAGSQCREFVQRMLVINKVSRSEPQSTDLKALTEDTIAFFRQSLGREPDIRLHAPDEPLALHADPVLLRNALFNLIHNAALADPKGTVDVTLTRTQDGGKAGCSIAVSDRGPGIAPDVAKQLFTPFFTTRQGGTGLGLSIAQHIAMQHGGRVVAANNADGPGARFTVWLPA